MTTPLISSRLRLPAAVRRSVEAEGSATWTRAVPGGRVVLSTVRRGSRLRTRLVRVEAEEQPEADDLDFAMLG